ncbi:MAG: hypothetical protein Q9227_002994 [Pyrenula ochraceoflavens]
MALEGLLVGQLSVVLLIGAFIKFFIFGEAPFPRYSTSSDYATSRRHLRSSSLHNLASKNSPPSSLRHKASIHNILRPIPSTSTNIDSILRKTYYQTLPDRVASAGHARGHSQHSSHQPESLDWFNVLIAQAIAQYRQAAYNQRDATPLAPPSILTTLTAALNNPSKKPSFIDKIAVTEISLGEEFPIFSNCRVIALEDDGVAGQSSGGRLQALMDVDLSDDNLTLGIETSLILNYPKPFSAVLPVALVVSVVRFSGTLSISFVPASSPGSSEQSSLGTNPQSNSTSASPHTNLAFSFLPDYRLELSVRSLVGSRSRLQDVPKIAQLVEARVQTWFEERVVEPRVQVVGLPGLWPRMGRTNIRGGDEGQNNPVDASSENHSGVRDPRSNQEEQQGLRMRSARPSRPSVLGEDTFRMPGALPDAQVFS